jgi:hypothetical protein
VPSVIPASAPSPNYASRLESAPGSPGVSAVPATDSCAPSSSAPGWCDSPMQDEAALVHMSHAEAAPNNLPGAPAHLYGTRVKHNIHRPKVWTDGTVTLLL